VTEGQTHGFPWRITALVAAIVILATVVAGLILARNGVQTAEPDTASIFTPAPDLLPVEKQRQVTVLFQVRDKGKDVASNVLIGAGGDVGFVSELLLPRTLLLPTSPPVQLKDVNGPRGPVSAQGPLQVVLNVQIDATIELDRLAWAGLIDSTGALDDPEQGQSAGSFPLVVSRVLAKLPPDEETLGQLLTSLGSMAPTTVTNEDASHLLAVLGASLRAQPVKQEVLPVTYIRGGASPVATAQQPAATEVVTRLFPKAPLKPGHSAPARLVLQRAGATLGAALKAHRTLAQAGFGVLDAAGPGRTCPSTPPPPSGWAEMPPPPWACRSRWSRWIRGRGPPSTSGSSSDGTSRRCERVVAPRIAVTHRSEELS
jgi:hypothetical protein